MDTEHLIALLALVGAIVWFVPALIFSVKVLRTDELESHLQKQLLIYLWVAPVIGAVICAVMFSKIGKLRKLSESEHKSIWAAHHRR